MNATGNFGYGKIDEPEAGYMLYFYFDTWDIGTATGSTDLQMVYNNTALWEFYVKCVYGDAPSNDTAIAISYTPAASTNILTWPIKITTAQNFVNSYTVTNTSSYQYILNVSRNVNGVVYGSYWYVYTSSTVFLNETTYDTQDFSILIDEAPIYLECIDLYNNTYTATIYGMDTGKYNVHGHTINAENNAIISNVLVGVNGYVNHSNETAYYQVDGLFSNSNYNLSATKTAYMAYDQNITVGNRNVSLDIPLFLYGLDGAGDYNSSIPYLAGVVKNHFNYSSIKNCVVTLRNNTTTYNDVTNSNGLFTFYPDANGTYTLTVIKPGYYTSESSVNVQGGTSANVALMPIIEEVVKEEEPPKTITDSIFHMFEKMGFSDVWVKSIIALGIISVMGFIFGMKKDSKVTIMGMFMGFIVTIALGLLPTYFLTIVIIIVIAMIIQTKTGG